MKYIIKISVQTLLLTRSTINLTMQNLRTHWYVPSELSTQQYSTTNSKFFCSKILSKQHELP